MQAIPSVTIIYFSVVATMRFYTLMQEKKLMVVAVLVIVFAIVGLGLSFFVIPRENRLTDIKLLNLQPCLLLDSEWTNVVNFKSNDLLSFCGTLEPQLSSQQLVIYVYDKSKNNEQAIYFGWQNFSGGEIVVRIPKILSSGTYILEMRIGRDVINTLEFYVDPLPR